MKEKVSSIENELISLQSSIRQNTSSIERLLDDLARINDDQNEINQLFEDQSAKTDNRINDIIDNLSSSRDKIEKLDNRIDFSFGLMKEEVERYETTTKLKTLYSIGEIKKLVHELHKESLDNNAETDSQIRQYLKNEITIIEDRLDEKLHHIQEMMEKLITVNSNLLEENRRLKKELEFYTEIESDSNKLNISSLPDNTDRLLDDLEASISSDTLLGKSFKEARKERDNSETPERIINSSNINKEDTPELKLDEDQLEALSFFESCNDNAFITGKAGTGKSFLLSAFARLSEKRGYKLLKVAPTGIAALNIKGTTIHRAFGYDNLESVDIAEIDNNTLILDPQKRILLQQTDIIIIDEISMVNPDTFDKMDLILRIVCKDDRLFAGKRMILFGDMFQLEPVVNQKSKKEYLMEKYGSVFFFDSESYKKGAFHFIELKTNHRQKNDSVFFNMLNRIREGSTTEEDYTILNERVLSNKSEARRILTLYSTKAEADKVNQDELSKIHSKEYRYPAKIVMNNKADQTRLVDYNLPYKQELVLKVGALIMMTANDPQNRWVNGTLGIVKKLEPNSIEVTINSQTYEVPLFSFRQYDAVYKEGRIKYEETLQVSQYPILLAYAMTIHKSQGMTYQQIAVDLSRCFASGQAYVALSRCSSLEGLHLLSRIKKGRVSMVNPRVKEFYLEEIQKEKKLLNSDKQSLEKNE